MKYYCYMLGLFLISLASGCLWSVPPPRTCTYTADGAIEWSEYYESIQMIADDRVMAHLIITLGDERLPKDALIKNPLAPSGRLTNQDNIDGLYEAVSEIYFTNKSKNPISIELISINIGEEEFPLRPNRVEIQPGKFIKSEPVVCLGSVFWHEYNFSYTYLCDGNKNTIKGIAKRLRVSNLGKEPSTTNR